MKDILVLLVLLNAHTTKVCSQAYRADSDGKCRNSTTEYLLEDSDLCCKKCLAGQRLKEECSETTETVCEQCPTGQYKESWNYAPNCFKCPPCKSGKGLQETQSCSSTTSSRCECKPGRYCIMEFDDPYCAACSMYRPCKAGYGVSVPGTGNADVRCQRCPNGMFSDTVSPTDRCRPHTNCHGRVVVRKGDATSDTKCGPETLISNIQPQTSTKQPQTSTKQPQNSTKQPQTSTKQPQSSTKQPQTSTKQPQSSTKQPHTEMVFTTASTVMSTVLVTSDSKAPSGPTDSTMSVSTSVSEGGFNYSIKSPPPSTVSDSTLAAVTACVIGVLLFLIFIAVILLLLRKRVWEKDPDAARFHPKVDANGNCESGDKIIPDYLGETQLTSFTVTSPEQQRLLQNGEAGRDHSQCSNNTETLTQTDGCSSQESIGPLQSTVALHDPHSALSEPLSLHSNTEPVTPQPSIPTQPSSQPFSQPSSQPTSPQVISPVTTSPHVNVNITFHIGNGSCGTPSSITPTDLMQVVSKLPFGEEEESFSIPQQEAGKQSLMSVQETESYRS